MHQTRTVVMAAHPDDPTLISAIPESAPFSSEYRILQAVVRAASAFLRVSDLSDSLDALLAGIGEATGASRVYVFENDPRDPGDPVTSSQSAEWTAPGVQSEIDSPAVRNISLETAGFEQWVESFAAGAPFVAITTNLPSPARERLLGVGVLSIAAVPVLVDDEYWGFIGVDNCVSARLWNEVEVDALAAGAVVLGAAVRRRRAEESLRHATTQARLAADIGEVVTRAGDSLQEMLDLCSEAIVRRLEPDLIRIWMMSETLDCLIACTAAGVRTIQDIDATDMPLVSQELMRIATSREPAHWRDELPELWPNCQEEYDALSLRGGVAFPLITNGRVNGVAILLGRTYPQQWVVDALDSVTDELALAIERHHAQGAAARAELRYRRLVTATVEGIIIHDGQRVIDANPSFATMVGYSPEEVLQMHPFAFIPPEYHEFVRHQIENAYEHPYEIEGVRKDGVRFPVELKGSDFSDNGRMLRVAAVRDISDRRKVEQTTEQLREEQHARAVAENTRAQAQFLAEASRVLASSLDTTTTLTQLAHLAIPTLADYCIVSTFDDSEVRRVAIVHGDPSKEPVLRATVDAWPERFPDDHPIFSALMRGDPYVVRDVAAITTAQIAANDQHRQQLDMLNPRSIMAVPIVGGGTVMGSIIFSSTRPERLYGPDDLALAQEFTQRAALALQTARSYHDAQAATRSRDEMLAVVAHDLRNPLNTIFMGSELALEMMGSDDASPGARQLHIIRRSAEQMNRLIQDLLDASRIDSGNLALELISMQPADLLREACEMLAPLAAHARIAMDIDAPPGLPALQADKGRLLQVMSNLVGNGLKFTPAGGRIVMGAAMDEGAVAFRVADSGCGIPADQLPHIFARGWQARKTDKRGIGLGLAIASGIVHAHGGTIRVESLVGEGTTFYFTVPIGGQSLS